MTPPSRLTLTKVTLLTWETYISMLSFDRQATSPNSSYHCLIPTLEDRLLQLVLGPMVRCLLGQLIISADGGTLRRVAHRFCPGYFFIWDYDGPNVYVSRWL